jgi:enoyl-CoA hydratase/carnithine racemase
MTDALRLAVADGLAALTIDQPGGKVNVLNRALWEEFAARLAELAGRADLRGLVVQSGKPGMFLAGADLREIAAIPIEDADAVRALVKRGADVLAALEALPFPTAALIDGPALGGGLEVALACDYRLASTNPRVALGLPEVKLGLIPGWGGTQRLPRLIGVAALLWVAGGESGSAEAARVAGLVDEVVPSERLSARAAELVAAAADWRKRRMRKQQPVFSLAHGSTGVAVGADVSLSAAQSAARVIREGGRLSLAEGLAVETEEFVRLVGSAEARERIAAFFARRGG